jgi:flagellar motor switch protein FliN
VSVVDGPESWQSTGPIGRPDVDAGPLGHLPSLTRRAVQLEKRLGPDGPDPGPTGMLSAVSGMLSEGVSVDRFEVLWRASGLKRPGVIANLTWPRLATRVGLGLEPALAHAIVDRLLGFERLPAEGRLQVTPVEWGILSFAIARALDRLDRGTGPLGPWDLMIDRVGPGPFDPSDLGSIVTWRWRVRLGSLVGSIRLWLPESLLALWLSDEPSTKDRPPIPIGRLGDLSSVWRAEAGRVEMPRGLGRLHAGSVLPIEGSPLRGTPKSPKGVVELALTDRSGRMRFLARPFRQSGAARLILESPMSREPRPRETHVMTVHDESTARPSTGDGAVAPADVPVTLTVELGRINLPLGQLADLKPGDVLELGRHAREPVELTSGGRTVARGELVQIESELGVRVTHVFL